MWKKKTSTPETTVNRPVPPVTSFVGRMSNEAIEELDFSGVKAFTASLLSQPEVKLMLKKRAADLKDIEEGVAGAVKDRTFVEHADVGSKPWERIFFVEWIEENEGPGSETEMLWSTNLDKEKVDTLKKNAKHGSFRQFEVGPRMPSYLLTFEDSDVTYITQDVQAVFGSHLESPSNVRRVLKIRPQRYIVLKEGDGKRAQIIFNPKRYVKEASGSDVVASTPVPRSINAVSSPNDDKDYYFRDQPGRYL